MVYPDKTFVEDMLGEPPDTLLPFMGNDFLLVVTAVPPAEADLPFINGKDALIGNG